MSVSKADDMCGSLKPTSNKCQVGACVLVVGLR
jgi:hypothetical protein